ncbi:MAG: DUF2934 domain-containing protein [Planctomycetia bacterium]|nr:DUF2934 domain-containing protein [Planctomycetia bacterium]
MSTTLTTLELLPDEMAAARERIRVLAYEKWLEAGAPDDNSLSFWVDAERAWIEHEYVPHRDDLDLGRVPSHLEKRRVAK